MADVILGILEAEEGHVPPLCIRCGKPATVFRSVRLAWSPDWMHLLLVGTFVPFVIITLLSRKRMRVNAPFCDAHRNYWRNRRLMSTAAFLIPLLGLAVLFLAFDNSGLPPRLQSPFVLAWGLSVAWLLLFTGLRVITLRASRIDEESIELSGAAPEFVERLAAERAL
jgi:hypothetical protein